MHTLTATPTLRRLPRATERADGFVVPLDPAPAEAPPARVLDSTALLQGQKVVEIVHNGFLYRLQATKLGKLILTK